MKKKSLPKFLAVFIALLVAFSMIGVMGVLTACNGDENGGGTLITGITLSHTAQQSVVQGTTLQLAATVQPATANQNVTWTSSHATVASVNAGLVTGLVASPQVVTITATSTNPAIAATVTVVVTAAGGGPVVPTEPVESISVVNMGGATLSSGQTTQLLAAVLPVAANQNIIWTQTGTGSVTGLPTAATPGGNPITVTAGDAGSVTISARPQGAPAMVETVTLTVTAGQITTAAQFLAMTMTGSYELANDITFDAPIEFPANTLGTEANPFRGNLNGNGHTLINVHILTPVAYSWGAAALFPFTNGATIQNLNIVDAFNTPGTGLGAGPTGAILIGNALNTTIRNVFVSGSIEAFGLADYAWRNDDWPATSGFWWERGGAIIDVIGTGTSLTNVVLDITSLDGFGAAIARVNNSTIPFVNVYVVQNWDLTYMSMSNNAGTTTYYYNPLIFARTGPDFIFAQNHVFPGVTVLQPGAAGATFALPATHWNLTTLVGGLPRVSLA